jgi:hypothetical protein
MLSDAQGVVTVDGAESPPPDVFVVPDDFDEDPVVLMDDDDEDSLRLLGILNMDGIPDE